MSARGDWIHEGERIDRDGAKAGTRRGTNIASYWLGGVAAVYQSWESILLNEFQALSSYLRTGEESALKFTRNTDQAAAYLPKAVANRRSASELQMRREDLPQGSVPEGVRFLTAAVDVQSARFVVHVFGWGVGLESWLIDRFTISSSKRPEGDRTAALDPAAYLEDWELIREQVIDRSYGGMQPRLVMCDSGGKAGVTAKAYAFFRWLRKRRMHKRFRLVKGASRLDAATATLTWPDASDRKDRKEGGRGDVPVWLINTNVLKDAVVGDLARTEIGPGYVHLPKWLDETFFAELTAETRTDKGWKNTNREPNEAFDLHVYNRAACKVLKADKINWNKPPSWARPPEPEKAEMPESAVAERAKFIEQEQRHVRKSKPERGWVKKQSSWFKR